MYTLLIKPSAERDLRRLPEAIFRRINESLLALRDNPRPGGTVKLSANLKGWRLRVGDYRILYQINDDARMVTIVRIRHRRDVYR